MKKTKTTFVTSNGLLFIDTKNISYFKADNMYAILVCKDSNEYLITKSLKILESELSSDHFLRVHKSFMVNMVHVDQYFNAKGGQVQLECGVKIPISRTKKSIFWETLKDYID